MIVYVNGDFILAEDASVSIYDRGLTHGDGVFDNARTFGGRPFALDAHLERLQRSLRYIGLDGHSLVSELRDVVGEVIERNIEKIRELGDISIIMLVTRGRVSEEGLIGNEAPTRIVMTKRLDFHEFGPLYESGVELISSVLVSNNPGTIDPRVKTTSKGAVTRAELQAARVKTYGSTRGTFAVKFALDGSIAESHASNLCIVSGSRLVRPPKYQGLEGVSIETLGKLALQAGLEIEEHPIRMYDLINADEVLVAATSYSVLPVVALDGIRLNSSRDVYDRLLKAWIDLVGFDFVSQAQERAAGTA